MKKIVTILGFICIQASTLLFSQPMMIEKSYQVEDYLDQGNYELDTEKSKFNELYVISLPDQNNDTFEILKIQPGEQYVIETDEGELESLIADKLLYVARPMAVSDEYGELSDVIIDQQLWNKISQQFQDRAMIG